MVGSLIIVLAVVRWLVPDTAIVVSGVGQEWARCQERAGPWGAARPGPRGR